MQRVCHNDGDRLAKTRFSMIGMIGHQKRTSDQRPLRVRGSRAKCGQRARIAQQHSLAVQNSSYVVCGGSITPLRGLSLLSRRRFKA